MLIKILILFFIFLLFYQTYVFIIENNIFLKENNNVIEGYTDYEETSYMLSQKNAVNIQDLKERIDKITTINNNYDVLNNRLTLVEFFILAISLQVNKRARFILCFCPSEKEP